MADNLLPKFFELIDQAGDDVWYVDMFDLRSEDPKSMAEWTILLEAQSKSCKALVEFCAEYSQALIKDLGTA